MYLMYSSSRRTVRAGESVEVAGSSLTIKEIKKPNSKQPQGVVILHDSQGSPVKVVPALIKAEWSA